MKLKLSKLSDDIEVSAKESHIVYTVAELKREILELGEPHHETSNWYTIERKRWSPDAYSMVESYIENEYCNMYDGWNERAMDCITDEVVDKIQAILNEAFKGDYATAYWEYDKPVEIDVFPNNKKV